MACKPPAAAPTPTQTAPAAPATNTVTNVGICQIQGFDAAEGLAFLNTVYGFSGKTLTDSSDASIQAQAQKGSSTAGSSVNVNVYNFPETQSLQTVQLSDVAQILGLTPQAAANQLGVNATSAITLSQAAQLVPKNDNGGIMAKIQALTSKKQAFSSPGFEAMQVTLPNGKSIALSDLYKLQQINEQNGGGGSCLLDNSVIHGRVSFLAQLNQNLVIGSDRSTFVQNSPQHLSTTQYSLAINSYDGNVVIPHAYEEYAAAIKTASVIDEYFSLIIGAGAAINLQQGKSELTSVSSQLETADTQLANSRKYFSDPAASNVLGSYEKAVVSNGINPATAGQLPLPSILGLPNDQERMNLLAAQLKMAVPAGKNVDPAALTTAWNAYTAANPGIDGQVTTLVSSGFIPGEQSVPFINALTQDAKQYGTNTALTEKLATIKANQPIYESAWKVLNPKIYSNFLFGALWLGPGRLALSMAGNIFFQSENNPLASNGNWIMVYAGSNQVAQAFSQATDWFMSGQLISLISDFTKSGTPSKVFNVGKVMYVQEAGSSQGEQDSLTSVSNSKGVWTISFNNWPGQAQSTMFEDVSDNRATTSMAISENNSLVGGTVQRSQTAITYYNAMQWAVPLLAWTITGATGLPSGVSLIARLGLQDFYINNLIDPAGFPQGQVCDESKISYYVTRFDELTALSVATSVLTQYYPPAKLQALLPQFEGLKGAFSLAGSNAIALTYVIDPITLWKQSVGATGFQYVSSCKDYSYKVLAYQNIPQDGKKANSAIAAVQSKISNPLSLPNLNIFSAIAGAGSQPAASQLQQILNIKTVVQNQAGTISPDALYSFQLNPSTPGGSGQAPSISWFDQYEQGCFRSCLVDSTGKNYACADQSGCYKQNPDGSRNYFCSQDQALNQKFIPGLGTFIPNKIITATLACSPTPVLQATGSGSLTLLSGSCAATTCTLQSLAQVSGKSLGSDLSYVLGPVQAIYTDEGVASVSNSQLRFFRSTGVTTTGLLGGTNTNTTATGTTSSGVLGSSHGSTQSLAGTEQDFNSLDILGNGQVQITGGNPSVNPTDSLGEIRSVFTQNGVISYNPYSHQLKVIVQVLATVRSSDLNTITALPATIQSNKADYTALVQNLASLQAQVAAGQALSSTQLALLQQALEKPQVSSAGLSPTDQAALQQILAKQGSGQALTPAETALLAKVQQQQPFGVVVLTPAQAQSVDQAMAAQGTPNAATISSAIHSQAPLTTDQANAASQAVAGQVKSGVLTQSQGQALQSALQAAVPTSAQSQQIMSALASGQPLTPQQQAAVQAALQNAQQVALNQAANAPTSSTPAIKLVAGSDKVGGASSAAFNTAMGQIGGLTQLQTPTQNIGFGTNSAGQSVLNIQDKATGQTQSLPVTGPLTSNGNAVTVPTANGPVQISVNLNPSTGAPQVTLNTPNGGSTTQAMPIIEGPNGMLYYDPNTGTWQALNGLGISADPNFGKYGAQFTQNSAGTTTGAAASDPFGLQQSLGGAASSNPLLSLPSWPEQLPELALMLALVAAGMVAVRLSRASPRIKAGRR